MTIDPVELERLAMVAAQARRAYELEPNTGTLTAFMNAESAFAWALTTLRAARAALGEKP